MGYLLLVKPWIYRPISLIYEKMAAPTYMYDQPSLTFCPSLDPVEGVPTELYKGVRFPSHGKKQSSHIFVGGDGTGNGVYPLHKDEHSQWQAFFTASGSKHWWIVEPLYQRFLT